MRPGPLLAAAALVLYAARRRARISRGEWIGGGIVLAGLLVYGTGIVHPPSLESLIKDAGEALGPWTYLLVGVMAFLETGAFVGLIAPGEFTILVGGVVAGQGKIDVIALIAIVWACAVAGDLTSYALGRRLGREFMVRHGPKVKITHERLEKVEGFFQRHGGKAILIGRFIGLVRAVAPFLAGSARMPLRKFVPYDVVGAGLWGSIFVVLGYVFWHSFDQVAEIAKKGALALGAAIALGFAIVAAARWLREEKNRRQAERWLERQSRRPLLRPLAAVVIPVVRWATGPAKFAYNRVTPGDLGLELTTLLALAGVGAFTFIGYWHTLTMKRFTLGDLRALHIAGDLRAETGVRIAKVVTALGALPVTAGLAVGAALILLSRRKVPEAFAVLIGMTLTVIAVHWAKDEVGRPRPVHPLVSAEDASYPSGHSAYAVAWVVVAVALSRTVPGLAGKAALLAVAIMVAVLVGLTRIYLRAHFLSDVLGGYGLATALFSLSAIAALLVGRVRQNSEAR